MTIYIVGEEGNLGTTENEPRVLAPRKSGGVGRRPTLVVEAIWLASGRCGRHVFSVKRGVLEEYRSFDDNTRYFARVLPDDARPTLEALDAKLEAAEAEVTRLRQERRVLLDAVVSRGERVRVKVEP